MRNTLRQIKIGNTEINGAAALAPMAGCSDLPFRELCRSF
ncbi:MAG TPA: tRNA dihydrouridine synthase DusB, partial [Clostridiales bacterium]|nr:tRNA dihydrouridine synthase DusB [Clostridiales bacterium]